MGNPTGQLTNGLHFLYLVQGALFYPEFGYILAHADNTGDFAFNVTPGRGIEQYLDAFTIFSVKWKFIVGGFSSMQCIIEHIFNWLFILLGNKFFNQIPT